MKKLIILLFAVLAVVVFSGLSLADETRVEKSAYTAEQLIGQNINSQEGKHVDIIRDVNQNSVTGEINYVILGKSLLGIGKDKFSVPLEALKISNDEGITKVALVVSEDKLISAPNFESAGSGEEFKDILLDHYCTTPDFDEFFNVQAQC